MKKSKHFLINRIFWSALAMWLISGVSLYAAVYHQKIDTFITKVGDGKVDRAIQDLYGDNPWIQVESDAVQNVKNQLNNLIGLVGTYRGHVKLQEKIVADRFVYLHYLVVYDRQPISFIFEYYKPAETWMVFSFSFHSDIDEWIEKSAREELLKEK